MASYGISITTLEEVFLAVGDGRDIGEHALERQQVRKKVLAAQGVESNTGVTDADDGEDRQSLLNEEELSQSDLQKR